MKINVVYQIFRVIGATRVEIYANFIQNIDETSAKKPKINKNSQNFKFEQL